MRIKMTFKYDGSKFSGFQRLNNERTVQKEIENALKTVFKKEIEIKGSGRTDAKVHANGQVAHFDIDNKVTDLKRKLNSLLMPDIVIKNIKEVKEDFHARHSVKKKEYVYKINLGPYQSSLNDYYFQPHFKLDIKLMKEASKYMLGTHDFGNFISGKRDNSVTTIKSIEFVKLFDKLEIRFVGTGFYRYMVRNLVGALLEVGKCKVGLKTIDQMINNPNKEKTLPTAASEGLYLNRIWY